LFNGNPLLRYDGYYILSDLLEIPNLLQRATRYWGYLVDRHLFRTDGVPEFVATPCERGCLLLYAPASFLYCILVVFAIALFVASEYRAIGVAIALWGLLVNVALPIAKALWQVFTSPRLKRNRARAVASTGGFMLGLSVLLFSIPA